MTNPFLIIGGTAMGIGVALGAFGSHALKAKVTPGRLSVWETANQYHFLHAIGLLIIGVLLLQGLQTPWLRWSGYSMLLGLCIFSGSLYTLVLSNQSWLGAVTPIGGLALILSWVLFVIGVAKHAHT